MYERMVPIRTNHRLHYIGSFNKEGRVSCLLGEHGSVSRVPNYKVIGLRFEAGNSQSNLRLFSGWLCPNPGPY